MEKISVECSMCGIVGSYETILNHISCEHPDPETNNCESQAGCSNVQESQEKSEVDETDNSKSNIFVFCGNYKQIIFLLCCLWPISSPLDITLSDRLLGD